jgi:hypothetical protein
MPFQNLAAGEFARSLLFVLHQKPLSNNQKPQAKCLRLWISN